MTGDQAPALAEQRWRETLCPRVLHIDWDGDPVPVREDIAQCSLMVGHGGCHQGKDARGSWFRW